MDHRGHILVTGATGFVGHHVLAALLRAGRRCAALVSDSASGPARLDGLLGALGLDAPRLRAEERLVEVPGRLPGAPDVPRGLGVDAVLHVAASTRFDAGPDGDPHRTNVAGTTALLAWAADRGVRRLDHVSTAFAADLRAPRATETPIAPDAEHRNDYERSKAEAERRVQAWWRAGDRDGAVLRPSIVVGAFGTGRATRFAGPYLAARAAAILAASLDADERATVPLRMLGRPETPLDLVPADWVGAMCAAVAAAPGTHRIVNLVHPAPPTCADWQRAIERTWGLAGGRFVGPDAFEREAPNAVEAAFLRATGTLRGYLLAPPTFARTACAAVERATGLGCPRWDAAALDRLLAHARRTRFGAPGRSRRSCGRVIARYFESWLGEALPRSAAVRRTRFTGAVRFAIDDVERGTWWCRFHDGLLAEVRRGDDGAPAACAFRMDEATFWAIVAGALDAETGFLDGRVDVHGDVERAMALGTVLREFNRECRVDRAALEEHAA